MRCDCILPKKILNLYNRLAFILIYADGTLLREYTLYFYNAFIKSIISGKHQMVRKVFRLGATALYLIMFAQIVMDNGSS